MYQEDEYGNFIRNQPTKPWKNGHVYVIDYGDGKLFKIGYTCGDVETRFKQICRGGSVIMPMRLVMSVETETNCSFVENILHMKYDLEHRGGEWFELQWIELVEIWRLLSCLGWVELYDGWYPLVPDDVQMYVDREKSVPHLPFLSKTEKEDFYNIPFGVEYVDGK